MLQTVCKILSALLVLLMLVSCGDAAAESSSETSSEPIEVVSEVTSEVQKDTEEKKESYLSEREYFNINPAPDKSTGNAKHNKESELYLKNQLIENNITITEKYENDDENNRNYYLVIDGLKDEKVEKAINDRIFSVYQKMCSDEYIPPIRGIKLTLKRNKNKTPDIQVYSYCFFNCNNLLSVETIKSVNYEDDSYSYNIPLTFDLATGKELTLADLFFEDVDYISLLNKEVDKTVLKINYDSGFEEGSIEFYNDGYNYDIGDVCMTAPFKTIKPDQKFYIDSVGNIVLKMDYNTPEFFNPQDIYIHGLDKYIALTGISTDKIFENTDTVYSLRYKNYDKDFEDNVIKNDKKIYRSYYYNRQMPKETVNIIKEIAFNDKYTPDSIKKLYSEYTEDSIDSYYTVKYNCIGDYTCVTQTASAYIENGSEANDSLCYYCFKGNSTTPMKLSDFFVEGFDYKSALKKIFLKSLSEYDDSENDPETQAKNMVKHLTGIDLQPNGMNLSFDNQYYPKFVSYRDIGCENLTIFN